MNLVTRARLAGQLVHWAVTKNHRDIDYRPDLASPKFKSAREAVAMIPDGAVVMSAGMASNMRPSILFFATRDVFEETGHPRDLTWIVTGAMGGRGRVPGTAEELALPGLCTRYVSGHLETVRALLEGAAEGRVEIHTMSQGMIARLAEAQGDGVSSLESTIGVHTFLDPRVGPGTPVTPGATTNLVEAAGDRLRYRLPPITAACVLATEADEDGNVYMKSAAILTEVREAVRAAKANGGVAIVTVASVIPRDPDAVFLPASMVDAVVVCPSNEQTLSVPQRHRWEMFLPGAHVDVHDAMERLDFFNSILRLDPPRGPVEVATARAAAALFARIGRPGMNVITGYGMPIVVGRVADEAGLTRDVRFLIETGVHGGVPAPGLFFGTAINPERLSSSAEMFRHCERNLDATVLGMLQVDSEGSVNVSRKGGASVRDYVGPGGFPDLVSAARSIVFVGAFQARSRTVVEGGRIRVLRPGTPKFVERVDEVTFSGPDALRRGKQVFYVTPVATFRLGSRGLEIVETMPGIDPWRDVIGQSRARIALPEDGRIGVLPEACVTGEGFRLAWRQGFA